MPPRPDAKARVTHGQFTAAVRLSEGVGVAKNLGEAVRLYTLSADKGHSGAQNNLAGLYHHGAEGVPRDDAKAAHYFILAADQGMAGAQFNAG